MRNLLIKGRCVFAVIALAVMCLGFTTPALAVGETTYKPGDAKLTAVIVGPAGTDASGDEYVFHFAGDGTVAMQEKTVSGSSSNTIEVPVSDGVEQDNTTIKGGDTVPTIPDVTLSGAILTADNSLTNGQMSQAVVQKSLSEVLSGVTFPHAGIYTYVVTETSAKAKASDCYINTSSQAEYTLRIRVKNSDNNSGGLEIDGITVQQTKDDYGNDKTQDEQGKPTSYKVDPTYPTTDDNGKIEKIAENTLPTADELAGDDRGFNVAGFTFANEYIKSAPFQVKKLYKGSFSDKTKYSTVELTIHFTDAVTAVKAGSVLTYKIEGDGIDCEKNVQKLNGVDSNISQANDSMVTFDSNGWAYIKAELKEGSSICITGMFGPLSEGKRETISTVGLTSGLDYTVIEGSPVDYRPIGYEYIGTANVDPRTDAGAGAEGMSNLGTVTDEGTWINYNGQFEIPTSWATRTEGSQPQFELPPFAFFVTGSTTGSDTTVFVVNELDDNKVTATGILIDNLPYVLMIGIPVAVFIALFALKRRRNAVE